MNRPPNPFVLSDFCRRVQGITRKVHARLVAGQGREIDRPRDRKPLPPVIDTTAKVK